MSSKGGPRKKDVPPMPLERAGSFSQSNHNVPPDVAHISAIRSMVTVGKHRLAHGGNMEVWSACKEGNVIIRDARDGEVLHAQVLPGTMARLLVGVTATKEVWVGYSDSAVRVFKMDDPYSFVTQVGNASNTGSVGAIEVCGNSAYIGTGDGRLCEYDLRTKVMLRRFVGHNGPIHALASFEEAALLFSGSGDCTVGLWSLAPSEDTSFAADLTPTRSRSMSPQSRTPGRRSPSPDIEVPARLAKQTAGDPPALITLGLHLPQTSPIHMYLEDDAVRALWHDDVTQLLYVGSADGGVRVYDVAERSSIQKYERVGEAVVGFYPLNDYLLALGATKALACFDLGDMVQRPSIGGKVHRSPVVAVQEVAEVRVNPGIVSLRGSRTESGAPRNVSFQVEQHSYNIAPPEAALKRKVEKVLEEWDTLERVVGEQKQRLQDRLLPPPDPVLNAQAARSIALEQRLEELVAMHIRRCLAVDDTALLRRYYATWFKTFRARRRFTREANVIKFKREVIDPQMARNALERFRLGTELMRAKRKQRAKTTLLTLKNNKSIMRRYYKTWLKMQGQRALANRMGNIMRSQSDGLREAYYLKWRSALPMLKERRVQKELASVFSRSLGNGIMSLYFTKWRRYLDVKAHHDTSSTAVHALITQLSDGLLRIYFTKWRRAPAKLGRDRAIQASRDALFGGSDQYVRQRVFNKWLKFLEVREQQQVILRTADVLRRFGDGALRRVYYSKWRSAMLLRAAVKNRQNAAVEAFVRQFSSGVRRTAFLKWQDFVTHRDERRQASDAAKSMLRGTSRGLQSVYYEKWAAWRREQKKGKARNETLGVLLRHSDAGLQKLYYKQWKAFLERQKREAGRRQLARTVAKQTTMVRRSEVFQAWMARVITKRRLRFLSANANAMRDDDVMLRYFSKWRAFGMAETVQRSRRVRLLLDEADVKLKAVRLQEKQLIADTNVEKGRCMVAVSHSAELEQELEDLRQLAASLEEQRGMRHATHERASQDLRTATKRAIAYRDAACGNKPHPVPVVSDWYDDWKAMEKHMTKFRKLTDHRELPLVEMRRQLASMRDFANRAAELVETTREKYLYIPDEVQELPEYGEVAEVLRMPLFPLEDELPDLDLNASPEPARHPPQPTPRR